MAIQIVAETAMQTQIRHRTNSYLDKVNEELFMPRGQYVLVMKFKDQPPKQKKGGSPGSFSDMLGGLFSTEKVNVGQSSGSKIPAGNEPENEILEFDAAATISKITHSEEHPEMNAWTRRMKHYGEVSERTYNALELPECAPLAFPDIDRAAIRVREGKEPKSKFQSGRSWVRDYMDRKTQAVFVSNAILFQYNLKKAYADRVMLTRTRKLNIKALLYLSPSRIERPLFLAIMILMIRQITGSFFRLLPVDCMSLSRGCVNGLGLQ